MNQRRVELASGVHLAVTEAGVGPPVVLLHGIPGGRGNFEAALPFLTAHVRVIAPDLLGFGTSDPAPHHAHAAEQASWLVELLDALELPAVHLCGFDYGGPIAVLASARARARVRSLTVVSTNLFPDTPLPGPLALARVPVLGGLMLRLMFSGLGLRMMWRAATRDKAAFPLERFLRVQHSPSGIASARRVFLGSLRRLRALYAPVEAAAAAMDVPAAVVWGDRDPFFSLATAERTARTLRASLTVLPDCGHFVPEERPDALAGALLATVRRAS